MSQWEVTQRISCNHPRTGERLNKVTGYGSTRAEAEREVATLLATLGTTAIGEPEVRGPSASAPVTGERPAWMEDYVPEQGCRDCAGTGVFYGNVGPCGCLSNEGGHISSPAHERLLAAYEAAEAQASNAEAATQVQQVLFQAPLHDWRIVDAGGNPDNEAVDLPAALRQPATISVVKAGWGLGLICKLPDGNEAQVNIEIDGGAIKFIAFPPNTDEPGQSVDEHTASIVVGAPGVIVQSGHSHQAIIMHPDGSIGPHDGWDAEVMRRTDLPQPAAATDEGPEGP